MITNFETEISVRDRSANVDTQELLIQNHITTASNNVNTNTCVGDLRAINEVPSEYRNIFASYPYFNVIQSRVIDTALYTDQSMVISAPTGSGKTTIFELAIVRHLINFKNCKSKAYKVVYIAPIKALCEERLIDWHSKFTRLGLTCLSITGDSDYVDFQSLLNHDLIISTPEKWDSITRKWQDNKQLACLVKLFMIDEVQLLHDETRGSNLEVVVSRMKTIQDLLPKEEANTFSEHKIRFVAVSATVPNVEDIATWLSLPNSPAKAFIFGEETRPVKLKKVVIGYHYNTKNFTPFKFDIMMNYKLQNVIMQYAEGKPTLIFCGTRKSAEMTSHYITQNLTINLNDQQRQILQNSSSTISETKLKIMLNNGVSFHHAGLLVQDRSTIENLFRNGNLPVLVTTSTLAMGVNLPAHLVIVKSTKHYYNGVYQDYSECMVQQMIGRAGRPQYDVTATAVILTNTADKHKFENLVGGNQNIESSLHKHLTEHLNAEIVLRTITDLGVAMEWLTSTFLHIRARKNPRYYGLSADLQPDQIDRKLLDMCQIEINKLASAGMISIDMSDVKISPTMIGSLMAKYCVAFETMKLFTQVTGKEILQQVLSLIAKCKEFSEIYLRVNDKKALNLLNKCRYKETIRFPFNGKIKTVDMKINCIIQAVFGCLQIVEPSLITESLKIMRIGERISKCLAEYLQTKTNNCYSALLNALILAKCFHARLWENSMYVSKQLSGIGNVSALALVNAKRSSFQELLSSNPRDLERLIHRKPPMGNTIQEEIRHLPNYVLSFEKTTNHETTVLSLKVYLENFELLKSRSTVDVNNMMNLLVGDSENNILIYGKYTHSYFIENHELVKTFNLSTNYQYKITAHLISEDWVGIDRQIDVNLMTSVSVKDNIEKVVTPKKQKFNDQSASHVQTFINKYFAHSKGANRKLQNQTKKNKKPKRLNSEIQNKESTLSSTLLNAKNTLDSYLVNKTKGSTKVPDAEEKEIVLDTQKSLQAIVEDSIETYNKSTQNRKLDLVNEKFPTPSFPNKNSWFVKGIGQKQAKLVYNCSPEKKIAKEIFSYNKRKLTVDLQNSCSLHLKMGSSYNYENSELSQFENKPKNKLQVLAPSTKIIESNTTMQEENKKSSSKKNTNPKSITWSSPLVISPKFKHSPIPVSGREIESASKAHDETINLFLRDLNDSDSHTIQSENSSLINTKPTTTPSSVGRTRSTLRNNLSKSKREKLSLPLSDRACSQIEVSNTVEQLPSLKSGFNYYEDTLISTSFMVNMGLLNDEVASSGKLIDSTPQKEVNLKLPLVQNEYYSQLLSDITKNIIEEKVHEAKTKDTSSSGAINCSPPAVTQHRVKHMPDKPQNNGSNSTNSSSDQLPSSLNNNATSDDLFDRSDLDPFSETSIFESNYLPGVVPLNFEPSELDFLPVTNIPLKTHSTRNQENMFFGNSDMCLSNVTNIPLKTHSTENMFFGNSDMCQSTSIPQNQFLNQDEMRHTLQRPNLVHNFNTHSVPVSTSTHYSPFFVQDSRDHYDIRASNLNRNSVCHMNYESSRQENLLPQVGHCSCVIHNHSSHKHLWQCERVANDNSYFYSQPTELSNNYGHSRRQLKRFKAEPLTNWNLQNVSYTNQFNVMKHHGGGFNQNYVPFTQNCRENYIQMAHSNHIPLANSNRIPLAHSTHTPLTHRNRTSNYFDPRFIVPSLPYENTLNVDHTRNDYYENLNEDENI